MQWWAWMILGFILIAAELLTPGGFFVLFFGLAGVIVGFLRLADVAGPPWVQWLLFSGISVASIVLFRKPLMARFGMAAPKQVDQLVGEIGNALDDIAVNVIGKVELRGTPWTARNVGETPLTRGQRCKVEKQEGLTLFVRAE
ncbi:MAG TPA: NfeD family protein [Terriglobales bacterium]|nr:NfeD family protein [Terriglobales bacterium]